MPTKEELLDMVNNGVDRMLPARRMGRMALMSKVAAPIQSARSQDPAQFDKAITNSDKDFKNNAESFRFYNGNALRGVMGLPKKPAGNFDMDSLQLNEGEFGGRKSVPKSAGLPPNSNDVFKKGGKVKSSSASKRADGVAQRGKTRGKMR